ncbi:hypothetical protein EV356DRAFT_506165 [Viridothelium virens]|uniref:DUF7730 domain-containing protein n=1 Tax=Viridothelium virens TaxID=1048519 RepID=A0A6A6H287_VIRVR|nr:hypothetical protein EV356DRAFT_506165 [Viridothelium virens]
MSYVSTADALATPPQETPPVPPTHSETSKGIPDRHNPSPFFRLPRELRDKIYAYALTSSQPFIWPSEHSTHGLHPALLATSKAAYKEAAPILYSHNKFMFSHPSDANMFVHIMSREHAAAITNICLRIRDRDLRLWTGYLGSTTSFRSLRADMPSLKMLWIFFRSTAWNHLSDPVENFRHWQSEPKLKDLCMNLEGRTDAEVRVICCHRVNRVHFEHLKQEFAKELVVDPEGDARSAFGKICEVNVALELSCPE